jgi:hypothetical protein
MILDDPVEVQCQIFPRPIPDMGAERSTTPHVLTPNLIDARSPPVWTGACGPGTLVNSSIEREGDRRLRRSFGDKLQARRCSTEGWQACEHSLHASVFQLAAIRILFASRSETVVG